MKTLLTKLADYLKTHQFRSKFCTIFGVCLILVSCDLYNIDGKYIASSICENPGKSVLVNTFELSCLDVGDGTWVDYSVAFDSTQVTTTLAFSFDSSCTTTEFTQTSTGTYSLGSNLVVPSGTGCATQIDVILGAITFEPHTVDGVNSLNGASVCGLTNWTQGVTQIVNDLTCGGMTNPSNGSIRYSIYQIDTSVDPIVYYGADEDTGDGTTNANRPTDINTELRASP